MLHMTTNAPQTCGTGLRSCGTGFRLCGTGFQPVKITGCKPVPHVLHRSKNRSLTVAALWVRRMRNRSLTVTALFGALMLVGCATPAGIIFPPINPPVVWPGPPEQPRIRLVGTIAGSDDLRAARSAGEAFGTVLRGPRPPIRLSTPNGIAVRGGSVIAIADTQGGVVHVLDLSRRSHVSISGFGKKESERFLAPVGVAWADGDLLVSDAGRREVLRFDDQGRFLGRFGEGHLERPVGVVHLPGRDRIVVVDGGGHHLDVFSGSGEWIETIGRRGTGPGEFNFPTHITADGSHLIVADSGNFRVQRIELDGTVVGIIGEKGDAAGDFALPKGVALDSEGHLYVVDAQFENVQIFDRTGQLLLAFGSEGDGPGQFALPAGLTIDAQDRIWIADTGNRRIQVFQYIKNSDNTCGTGFQPVEVTGYKPVPHEESRTAS